jgi:hypothetical protein
MIAGIESIGNLWIFVDIHEHFLQKFEA